MYKHAIVGLAAAAFMVPAVAQQEGNWMVRARVVNLEFVLIPRSRYFALLKLAVLTRIVPTG
jgi:hypothetical protein